MTPAPSATPSGSSVIAAPSPLTLDGIAAGDRLLPDGAPRTPDAHAQRTRLAVTASVLALIVLGLAWELWLAPTGSGTLAIKVLPLLLPLPGLWRYRLYTYRWLSLLGWLYVGEGLVRATSERGLAMGLAWLEVGLASVVFVGCVLHVRGHLLNKTSAPEAAA